MREQTSIMDLVVHNLQRVPQGLTIPNYSHLYMDRSGVARQGRITSSLSIQTWDGWGHHLFCLIRELSKRGNFCGHNRYFYAK
jgi:hypothetical protein